VAAHAVALTPTVVALLDAKLIGERIFLFILLADRKGSGRSGCSWRAIRLAPPKVRESTAVTRGVAFLRKTRVRWPCDRRVVAR